jgi:SAM-dependent methyltransferase
MKDSIEKESVRCDLCQSAEGAVVALGTDREYPTSAESLSIVECAGCGLWYLNPRPTVAELDTIYPSNYHAYNIRPPASKDIAAAKPLTTRIRHAIYSRRFRHPLRFLEHLPSIDLLDIGCGDGWMLDLYQAAGAGRIKTFGVDFNEGICQVARSYGHTVYCGRFEDIDVGKKFDLANMGHVIEHVSSPMSVAQGVFELLRPGGIFVVETPNTDTWDRQAMGNSNWGALHIPRHWNLFNPSTIRRLGESAGFTLRELRFNPAPVHWVWGFHNRSLAGNGALARAGREFFAPLDVFTGGLKAFGMLGTFTLFDIAVQAFTGRTSNMMAIFQKPLDAHG